MSRTLDPAPPTPEVPPAAPAPRADDEAAAPHRPRRRRHRHWFLGAVALALTALVVLAAARDHLPGARRGPVGYATAPVTRTRLAVTVSARGTFESSKAQDVLNDVEGQTTILWIATEGTPVKKGELVCELDSASLRDQLQTQEITTRQAKATHENAIKTLEVAEMSLKEYIEGTYPQTLAVAKDNLAVAKTNLDQASTASAWSTAMLAKQLVPPGRAESDRNAKLNCEITHQEAEIRIQVLETYTHPKQVTQLKANIDQATVNESAARASLELETRKLEKLKKQVEYCRLVAPADGLVVYANENMGRGGRTEPDIQLGSAVRQRQKIFSIPDITHMRVNAKIPEADGGRAAVGQKVRVVVDAFNGQPLEGTITMLRDVPEVVESSPTVRQRFHTAWIGVENPPASLRPGMTARVDILSSESDAVLAVPVQAILPIGDEAHVLVVTPRGPENRKVELGLSNDTLIEIRSGLTEGELVVRDPASVLSDADLQIAYGASRPRSRQDEWEHP